MSRGRALRGRTLRGRATPAASAPLHCAGPREDLMDTARRAGSVQKGEGGIGRGFLLSRQCMGDAGNQRHQEIDIERLAQDGDVQAHEQGGEEARQAERAGSHENVAVAGR